MFLSGNDRMRRSAYAVSRYWFPERLSRSGRKRGDGVDPSFEYIIIGLTITSRAKIPYIKREILQICMSERIRIPIAHRVYENSATRCSRIRGQLAGPAAFMADGGQGG